MRPPLNSPSPSPPAAHSAAPIQSLPRHKKTPPTESRDSEMNLRSKSIGGLNNLIMSPIIAPLHEPTPEPQDLDITQEEELPRPKLEEELRKLFSFVLGGFKTTGEGEQQVDAKASKVPPLVWSALFSFITVQYLCACIPINLFLVGMLLSCCFAMVVFSCVGLLVLVPVLCMTGMFATGLWIFGWVCFLGGRYALKAMEEYERRGGSLEEDDDDDDKHKVRSEGLEDARSLRSNGSWKSTSEFSGQDQSAVW